MKKKMRINIVIAGKGGQGVNECSAILGHALTLEGYYCFVYRDYESRIEGGHIFNVLTIGDEPLQSHDWEIDILVVMDMRVFKHHENDLKRNGIIITEQSLHFLDLVQKHKLDKKVGNMIYAGAVLKVLGLEKNVLIKAVEHTFKGKIAEEDEKAVNIGYGLVEKGDIIRKLQNPIKNDIFFIAGNEGIGMGALASGLDVYFGYPMTPGTSLVHYFISKQVQENIFVYYPESEIAVVNAALGASYTGAKAMVGTSGGGYDLMTEGLSFQGMAELPLVVYLGQRAGPSTGLPTYSMQADLHLALKSSHGEFPRVVIAPGDAEECITATNQAFYFAHAYRTLGIILSDKNLAENRYSITEIPYLVKVPRKIAIKHKTKGLYPNYAFTSSGVSLMGIPGKVLVKANSHEHDDLGLTIEDSATAVNIFDKRMKKLQGIEKDAKKFEMVKIYGNKKAKRLIIAWGSNKGAVFDYLKLDPNIKFLQILYMNPFPSQAVAREIKKAKEVYVCELNYTGQLADLIAEKTGIIIPRKQRLLKYDGRPFTPGEIKQMMKKR